MLVRADVVASGAPEGAFFPLGFARRLLRREQHPPRNDSWLGCHCEEGEARRGNPPPGYARRLPRPFGARNDNGWEEIVPHLRCASCGIFDFVGKDTLLAMTGGDA